MKKGFLSTFEIYPHEFTFKKFFSKNSLLLENGLKNRHTKKNIKRNLQGFRMMQTSLHYKSDWTTLKIKFAL